MVASSLLMPPVGAAHATVATPPSLVRIVRCHSERVIAPPEMSRIDAYQVMPASLNKTRRRHRMPLFSCRQNAAFPAAAMPRPKFSRLTHRLIERHDARCHVALLPPCQTSYVAPVACRIENYA